jgi:hypothetical protein
VAYPLRYRHAMRDYVSGQEEKHKDGREYRSFLVILNFEVAKHEQSV